MIRLPDNSVYRHAIESIEIAGDNATVVDCSVDDSLLIDTTSGVVLNDEIATYRFQLTLSSSSGSWKTTSIQTLQEWDGEDGCAL